MIPFATVAKSTTTTVNPDKISRKIQALFIMSDIMKLAKIHQ